MDTANWLNVDIQSSAHSSKTNCDNGYSQLTERLHAAVKLIVTMDTANWLNGWHSVDTLHAAVKLIVTMDTANWLNGWHLVLCTQQ